MSILRRRFLSNTTALFATHGLACIAARGDDWPQWRGVNRDGVWYEKGVLSQLPDGQLPILWRFPISSGYSGPTVANGRVFVTDRLETPEQVERIHCVESATGQLLWSHQYVCPYTISYPAGPRASVAVVDGLAYALGSMGDLHAVYVEDGRIAWHRELLKDFAIEMPIWGISASPLVVDELVIVQVGGTPGACIVAMDAKTGQTKWTALAEKAQYSAPVLIEQAGQRIVVVWTGESVSGLELQSGRVAWSIPFPVSRMPIGVATPVVSGNRIFLTSFYDGSMMLEFDPATLTAKKLWHVLGPDEQHTEALHSIISTPIFEDGFIYGVDSYGELRCLDASDGRRIWENKTATPPNRWSTIHFVRHAKETWMLNEAGEMLIAELTPQGYREISRAEFLKPTQAQLSRRGGKGVCWSHPAFAERRVFARNDEELICANLAAD